MTNYGLGGLCEQHIDPHGYLEGKALPPSRESLRRTGDMIGTFMAWLTDVGAGGGTSYTLQGMENNRWFMVGLCIGFKFLSNKNNISLQVLMVQSCLKRVQLLFGMT